VSKNLWAELSTTVGEEERPELEIGRQYVMLIDLPNYHISAGDVVTLIKIFKDGWSLVDYQGSTVDIPPATALLLRSI
jgi:hypothetical protein